MQYSIRIAAQQSGVPASLIRVWEHRYCALSPCRSETNRRQYCDEDIRRLKLLRQLTDRGHSISSIAGHCSDTLYRLASRQATSLETANSDTADLCTYRENCYRALIDYNGERLRELLDEARLRFGKRTIIKHLIAPMTRQIGDAWQEGSLRIAHEHLHCSVIRDFLAAPTPGSLSSANAPEMIVATPSGTHHEIGALLVASTSRDLGMRVTYLGASLPGEEIAACAIKKNARVVALSLVFPKSDPIVCQQLRLLTEQLPAETQLWLGGSAAESYAEELPSSPRLSVIHSLESLEERVSALV